MLGQYIFSCSCSGTPWGCSRGGGGAEPGAGAAFAFAAAFFPRISENILRDLRGLRCEGTPSPVRMQDIAPSLFLPPFMPWNTAY